MSWLVRRDVERGRDELNFSLWGADVGEFDDAAETIEEGSMPPRNYELLQVVAGSTGTTEKPEEHRAGVQENSLSVPN